MKMKIVVAAAVATCMVQGTAHAGPAEAEKWINEEFQPSVLS